MTGYVIGPSGVLPPPPVVGATTTWNPSDTDSGVTLSPDNLTATDNANDGGLNSSRAIAFHSTGLYYYEVLITGTTPNFLCIGIGNLAAALTGGTGFDTNSVRIIEGGSASFNNGSIGTGSAFAVGDTVGVAVDFGHTKIWFRTNALGWNNDVIGNQDPANNIGGFPFAGIAAGPYYPMIAVRNLNGVTANFGATAYAQTKPTGFSNW